METRRIERKPVGLAEKITEKEENDNYRKSIYSESYI
jgi:hypothetical protein